MKLFQVLRSSSEGDRIRREERPDSILVIEAGEFFYDNQASFDDTKTPYRLTVNDLLATDWQVERKEWSSK